MIERRKPNRARTLLQAPAVAVLFLWMIVPLGMTILFSFIRYRLAESGVHGFAGLDNYRFLWEDPSFFPAIVNTGILIGSVLAITSRWGPSWPCSTNVASGGETRRCCLRSRVLVMPTVSALVWKT